jgi:hypothetical protein
MNFRALLHQEDVLIERITDILGSGDQVLTDDELHQIAELRDEMIENKKRMESNPFFHSHLYNPRLPV